MMTFSRIGSLMAAGSAVALLASCSDSGSIPTAGTIAAPVSIGSCPTPVKNQVILCKIGSSATFDVTTPGGSSTVNLTDGGSATILTNGGPNQTASASEQAQSGVQLDSIVVAQGRSASVTGPLTVTSTVFTGTSTASAFAGLESGALITFYNTILPPPPVGCTFTQGYWKNHTNVWPSPYSPTAIFFTSGQTWIDNLNTPPKGNAYYILSHQYIAAVLNGAGGASAPANIAAAIATSTTYFQNPGASSLTSADLIALSTLLDNYNNGLAGVPHCP